VSAKKYLVSQLFNNIYGTYEDPLFKAKDIGDFLEIKDILSTVKDLDDDEKGVGYYPTPGGNKIYLVVMSV